MKNFIASCNDAFTLYVIFPAILLSGFFLTWRLKGIQVRKIGLSFAHLFQKKQRQKGSISHYEAVAGVLAGNFGTGNISGMAVALSCGGPGALVWMWAMAFFGAVIQYASCYLGVRYRARDEKGEYVGGPMYYLSKGLGKPRLAALFAVFVLIAAFTVGNLVQVNSVSLPLKSFGINPLYCGLGMAVIVGVVLLGGLKRFAKVASSLVPLMALVYLVTALVILLHFHERIGPAFIQMFKGAFQAQSLIGGAAGFALFKVITTGLGRGLFATDAGTGMAPILQASARTPHPAVDGLVTLAAPLLVMVICTVTGLVLIVTGAWTTGLQSTDMCAYAFSKGLGHQAGAWIVAVSLFLFAYTTLLAWALCAQRAAAFLCGSTAVRYLTVIYVLVIPCGGLVQVDWVWLMADVAISLMLTCNLIGVLGLSKEVVDGSLNYFALDQKRETF